MGCSGMRQPRGPSIRSRANKASTPSSNRAANVRRDSTVQVGQLSYATKHAASFAFRAIVSYEQTPFFRHSPHKFRRCVMAGGIHLLRKLFSAADER